MFLLFAMGLAVLALLVWVGRRPARLSQGQRLASALFSALAAVAAVVSGLRGGWIASLLLIALSAYLGERARRRYNAHIAGVDQGMTAEEARRVLGVPANASWAEIEAAYRRQMRVAHPDHGGSTDVAMRINAARDRLRVHGGTG